jgi:DnaJ-class molecular chaperone
MIDSTCHVCDGDKVIAGIDSVLVTLEKGVANGHTVTMSGAGDEFHDKASSDILFTFLEVPHKTFTRNNNDLAVKVQLSLEEALVGFSKEVRHLDGRQVKVERSRVT